MKKTKWVSYSGGVFLAVLLCGESVHAQIRTYEVHLEPQKFTLYSDPYNGNEIQVGGFSGLYPVAGSDREFYAVTDRGPAPDFTDADGNDFKVFAAPHFGPHIITVKLGNNGKAKIKNIVPLTAPNGKTITGLPTTFPATDIPYDVI